MTIWQGGARGSPGLEVSLSNRSSRRLASKLLAGEIRVGLTRNEHPTRTNPAGVCPCAHVMFDVLKLSVSQGFCSVILSSTSWLTATGEADLLGSSLCSTHSTAHLRRRGSSLIVFVAGACCPCLVDLTDSPCLAPRMRKKMAVSFVINRGSGFRVGRFSWVCFGPLVMPENCTANTRVPIR